MNYTLLFVIELFEIEPYKFHNAIKSMHENKLNYNYVDLFQFQIEQQELTHALGGIIVILTRHQQTQASHLNPLLD